MATDVIMPALGVAQEKGTLLNWRKAEGQSVTKGEPLMEIETDKATVEIEAPASGILSNVTASAGDEVPVGNRIAVILAPGEVAASAALYPHLDKLRTGSLPEGAGKTEDLPNTSTQTSQVRTVAQPNPPISPFVKGGSKGDFLASETSPVASTRILASPAAKRIAKERGIDLASVKGNGPDGAIVAADVLQAVAAPATSTEGPLKIKETVQLTAMRRIVGERMTKSKQTAPHFYLSMDVDMTEIIRRRSALKEKESLVPSINDFILNACAHALADFPSLNAAFTDGGVEIYSDINIGLAVALEEGLVVPVIRNADRLSLVELARQSRELADRAQNKKLFPTDYEGGTFTVSNLGMFGVDNFIAIINPPQCAILAVGQVAPRVVPFREGIAVRPMMTMSLSADHRVVDGAIGAKFLQEVKMLLEKAQL
ncbi:MAG TPA: dihydrolipoamide acetyltransferase family protein [Candidatus Binatia bacterium]|jgi:pyruvate dehydrogenase E2 component (dihydrolipoamide acetyltransferase)